MIENLNLVIWNGYLECEPQCYGQWLFRANLCKGLSVNEDYDYLWEVHGFDKGKCAQEGTFFANRFSSQGNFVNKKVGFRKN